MYISYIWSSQYWYISMVVMCWKHKNIMFISSDLLFQLCNSIYLAREDRDLVLEEDLFSKLLFLFRSPEVLIVWTRKLPDSEHI